MTDLHSRHIVLAVLGVLAISGASITIYGQRAVMADYLWGEYRLADVSYYLNPSARRAFEIGNYYFNWDFEGAYDLETARFYYQEALTHDQSISGPWYQLGRIDFLEGDFSAAILKFDQQIAAHPDTEDVFFDRAHYMRGLTYGYMRQFTLAERDFMELLERSGEDAHWAYYVDLGWIYFSQGKFEELGDVSSEGVMRYPDNPWILSNLGLALMNLGYVEAAPVFAFALEEAQKLTVSDWERAYPGNDPRLASQGLSEMVAAIEENLAAAGAR